MLAPAGAPWRRTLGVLAGLTSVAAAVGTVQLVTGTFTPPVSDLDPLGLESWVLPGLWLAATVAVPCAVVAVRAWTGSPRLGVSAVVAGTLLLAELAVQMPFVGLDPLQAVMGAVAAGLIVLGFRSGHEPATTVRSNLRRPGVTHATSAGHTR